MQESLCINFYRYTSETRNLICSARKAYEYLHWPTFNVLAYHDNIANIVIRAIKIIPYLNINFSNDNIVDI